MELLDQCYRCEDPRALIDRAGSVTDPWEAESLRLLAADQLTRLTFRHQDWRTWLPLYHELVDSLEGNGLEGCLGKHLAYLEATDAKASVEVRPLRHRLAGELEKAADVVALWADRGNKFEVVASIEVLLAASRPQEALREMLVCPRACPEDASASCDWSCVAIRRNRWRSSLA